MTTSNWLRTRSLALLLVGLMAWSAAGRVYVQCADGTPCPELPAAGRSADCCAADPCEDHSAPAEGPSCVLKAEAGAPFIAPAAPADLTHLALLAILPAASVADDTDRSFVVVAARNERPPACLAPKQCRSPRSPPPAHA